MLIFFSFLVYIYIYNYCLLVYTMLKIIYINKLHGNNDCLLLFPLFTRFHVIRFETR